MSIETLDRWYRLDHWFERLDVLLTPVLTIACAVYVVGYLIPQFISALLKGVAR